MAGDPNDEDDMFRVLATKEVCFMNRDLQERGFECLVKQHDIEHVTSNEDPIHISCIVTVLEDDCIEVPPPSVHLYKEAYVKVLQPKPLWKLSST
jgi:hypothetical protein